MPQRSTILIVFGLFLVILGAVTSVTPLTLLTTTPTGPAIPADKIDPILHQEVAKGATSLYLSVQLTGFNVEQQVVTALTNLGFKTDYAARMVPYVYGYLPATALSQAASVPGVVALWSAGTQIVNLPPSAFWMDTPPPGGFPTPNPDMNFQPNGTFITMYDAAEYVGAIQAQSRGYTGKNIKIAMMDTGIATQDLQTIFQGRVIASTPPSMLPNGGLGCAGQEGGEDEYGHGTATAAVAAGGEVQTPYHSIGIAPQAYIINAKVGTMQCTPFGSGPMPGNEGDFAKILEWAVIDEGADVVSASVGFPRHAASGAGYGTGALPAIIDTMDKQYGVPYIGAAGNEPEVGDPYIVYPQSSTTAIVVGTVSDKYDGGGWIAGIGQPQTCSFLGIEGCWEPLPHPFLNVESDRKGIDIVAPGGMWLGTWANYGNTAYPGAIYELMTVPTLPGSDYDKRDGRTDGWAIGAGTSLSTPIVAGAAALIQQYLGGRAPGNVEKIKSMLFGNTRDVLDPGYDARSGWGILNINAALPTPIIVTPPPQLAGVPVLGITLIVAGIIVLFAAVYLRKQGD